MNQNRDKAPLVVAMAILCLSYAGLYLALVEAKAPATSGQGPWPRIPRYRVGGDMTRIAFWPLQAADQRIRKRYWEFHADDQF